jgi:hypothetical protein
MHGWQTMSKDDSQKTHSRTKGVLELIHIDICGLLSTPSSPGSRYSITFTDDYSKKNLGTLLKEKIRCIVYIKNHELEKKT